MSRLLLLAAIALLAGCAGKWVDPLAERTPGAPAWPPPPSEARFEYVMSITRHQDLFSESGFWRGVGDFVGGPADSHLVRPYSLALHPAGGLLVGDPGARVVHFFDWKNRRYVAIGATLEGGLPSPVGLVAMPDGGILVADSRRGGVEQFEEDGTYVGPFCGDGVLSRPAGMALLGKNGEVAVVDVTDHRVKILAQNGDLVRALGSQGSGPAEFNFPTHLAGDEEGGFLVADSMNFRIQRISGAGEFVSSFGEAGNAQGNFAQPKGVAVIDGSTFAAVEGRYDSVIFFDDGGNLLMAIGGPGSEPGQFWLPAGLAFDRARGLLFVADSYNSRVQVFRQIRIGTSGNDDGEVEP